MRAPTLIALILLAAIATGCSRHYITLAYKPDATPPAITKLDSARTIHVKPLTFTGEGADHILWTNTATGELEHEDDWIWQPDIPTRITAMLRERLEAGAAAGGYTVAHNSVPRPDLVLDGEIQEFMAYGRDDDDLDSVVVRIKFVLYDPADPGRRNRLTESVRRVSARVGDVEQVGEVMGRMVGGMVAGPAH